MQPLKLTEQMFHLVYSQYVEDKNRTLNLFERFLFPEFEILKFK